MEILKKVGSGQILVYVSNLTGRPKQLTLITASLKYCFNSQGGPLRPPYDNPLKSGCYKLPLKWDQYMIFMSSYSKFQQIWSKFVGFIAVKVNLPQNEKNRLQHFSLF